MFLLSFASGLYAQTISTASLPGGIVGAAYPPQALSASGGTLPYIWSVVSGSLPTGLTLSSTSGIISGTPTAAGAFSFVIQVDGAGANQTGTRSFTIVVANPLSITTTSLPDGTFGSGYPLQPLRAAGGTPPYNWSAISGSPPPGIALSPSGVLSGTPTASGIFVFTVHVVDSGSPLQSVDVDLRIKIQPSITTTALNNSVTGSTYFQTLTAAPGATPYTWSVSSGSLPAGLSLSSNGVISGNPGAVGTFNFTITLTDSSVPPLTASKALSIAIQSGLTITTDSSLPLTVVGAFYSQTLTATGTDSLTWSIVSGIAPPGLTLSSNGTLAGTPTAASTFNFTVQASGGAPLQTATKTFRIVVNAALSIVTLPTLPGATPGVPYSIVLNAIGGVPTYSWTSAGSLPPGLSLTSDGTVYGTPGGSGTFQFSVQVSDSFNPTQTASRTFSITVASTLTITTTSLPNGAVGLAYSQTLAASGGSTPYTWTLTSGALPTGLVLSTAGVISGIPATGNTFSFSVSVTDTSSPSQSVSKSFTTTIQAPLSITHSSDLPLAVVGAFYSRLITVVGPSPLTWSVISGIAPPGLALTSSGALAGTPLVAGMFDFTVEARGGDPAQSDRKSLHIVVNDALKIVTLAALADGNLGRDYSLSFEASGGLAPYTWTSLGRVPPGLTFSDSGTLRGTPTGVGSFSFTLQVSDSFNPVQQVSRAFTVTIGTTLEITTLSLPTAIQNLAYSQQLQAAGAGPFTWLVTAGALPAGITLNAAGLLQGTPTEVGPKTFTVTLTDSRGAAIAREFTLVVGPPIPAFSVESLPLTLNPTQSSDLALTIASPFPTEIKGQLKLVFTSNAEVPSDDPMTQFSSGSRTTSFTIPANSKTAVFQSKTMLLTGTVAGTVRITANLENGPSDLPVATVQVPAIAPQMTDVVAVRTGGGLDVQITGYAPARRILSVEFIFDVSNGKKTDRVSLTRNVESDFAGWYHNATSTTFGSSFSFLQTFTIQGGDASKIEGVTVRLTNAQGSTSSATVRPK